MKFITSKNLLNQAKIVWKTLVVLLLSALLLAPTPVLALDYNGTLDSYVSNVKVELDGVLTSIKKLPNLSYENGKTTLAEIESKLEKIQSNAGENATNFQNLSDETQKEYDKILIQLKNLSDQVKRANQVKKEMEYDLIRTDLQQQYAERFPQFKGETIFSENYIRALASPEANPEADPEIVRMTNEQKRLANVIVLTNKISKLCDNLEKRINLARQKFGNVKEYADALNSFSDPDILTEISEVDKFIADLTNNLPLGS